jgi:hypothetical protein
MLMADTPALAPEYGYYQRLLARDLSEAADLVERHLKTEPPHTVYDALLLPALNYAERDRLEDRLSPDEEAAVIEATRELLTDSTEFIRRRLQEQQQEPASRRDDDDDDAAARPRQPMRVVAYATNGVTDELALVMLGEVLHDLPISIEVAAGPLTAADLVALIRGRAASVVCLADLPPSPPSKTRYLVRKLRAALPDLRIVVGRWAPVSLADESSEVLHVAGATLVASTLLETRTYLHGLVDTPPGSCGVRLQADLAIPADSHARTIGERAGRDHP